MKTYTRTLTTSGEAAAITAITFGFWMLLSIDAVIAGFPTSPFSDAGFTG